MAVFDESKVINALHTDKAEIGKKYWFADNYVDLKIDVTEETNSRVLTLKYISDNIRYPFNFASGRSQFLYPYEETEKKLVPFDKDDVELVLGKVVKPKNGMNLSSVHQYGVIVTEMWNDEEDTCVDIGADTITVGNLLSNYTFLDGTPCGKVVEE